jgi:hypothetical protein
MSPESEMACPYDVQGHPCVTSPAFSCRIRMYMISKGPKMARKFSMLLIPRLSYNGELACSTLIYNAALAAQLFRTSDA